MAFQHQISCVGYSSRLSLPVPKRCPLRKGKGFPVTLRVGSHWHNGADHRGCQNRHEVFFSTLTLCSEGLERAWRNTD